MCILEHIGRLYFSLKGLDGIVAGMLVSYPRMNVLRDSSSFSPAGASVMRQPSADDLDAAQQLVESARGDRQGNHAATAPPDQPYSEPDPTKSPSNGRTPERSHFDAPIADEVNGLGQVCRYVCSSVSNSIFIFHHMLYKNVSDGFTNVTFQ